MANLIIPDGGNIGSSSDTDAIAISSGGNVTLSQTLDGGAIGSAVTMSANQACVKTALNASGSAPIYACRAWVVYDQVNNNIVASGNISSATDNSEGNYTLNFTTAMPDANYAVVSTSIKSSGDTYPRMVVLNPGNTKSTTQLQMIVEQYDGTNRDESNNCIAIFG